MTEIEMQYLRQLLAVLTAQHAKLAEIISSLEEILTYENSTLVSAPCTKIDGKQTGESG